MKKLLLAFVLLFFAGFTHAATLSGKISDPINNVANLNSVKVTLNGDPANSAVSKKRGFKIDNFTPANTTIEFEKEGYISQTGTITSIQPIMSNPYYSLIYTDNNGGTPQPFGSFTITTKDITVPNGVDENGNTINKTIQETVYSPDTFTLPEIKLLPNPDVIISGKISAKKQDDIQEIKDYSKIKIEISGSDGHYADGDIDNSGNFTIKGYLGTAKKARNYTATFTYPPYESISRDFKIEGKPKKAKDVVFDVPTGRERRQDNLSGITGFGCDELMPKYLVGANCVENSDLEGDATDLAALIQKFGGKITGMISMIAVLLIVWNAFKIVTAAGEETQISEGKKGIMWTILGLAVTMFAYIIVKTVIMLAYTTS